MHLLPGCAFDEIIADSCISRCLIDAACADILSVLINLHAACRYLVLFLKFIASVVPTIE